MFSIYICVCLYSLSLPEFGEIKWILSCWNSRNQKSECNLLVIVWKLLYHNYFGVLKRRAKRLHVCAHIFPTYTSIAEVYALWVSLLSSLMLYQASCWKKKQFVDIVQGGAMAKIETFEMSCFRRLLSFMDTLWNEWMGAAWLIE